MYSPSGQEPSSGSISALTEQTLFERRESHNFHNTYEQEQKLLAIVRSGDIESLPASPLDFIDGSPGRLSRNQLRQEQNLFIALITLITRAAIEGGLPEETAFSLSDSFIQTSESAFSPEEVHRLSVQAIQTFTREVAARARQSGSYSAPIEQALDYIHRHLHYPLTLSVIAEAIGLSPCYLSRLFRQETGGSIVDYIQRERIEAAKNMLRYSDYTPAEIGNYLSFSTQSYFTRIFRKCTGTTPAAWRKNHPSHREAIFTGRMP